MKPGRPQARVTQPPRSRPSTRPSARSAASVSSICSAASSSATSRWGSGGEELDIPLLPGDPDPLALAAAEQRVLVARHLGEPPLAADAEMQLDEVAEELDEDDLALRRVDAARGAVLVDADGDRAYRDERDVALLPVRARRPDADADPLLVLDDHAVGLDLDDLPADDVVVAHEARHDLGRRLRRDR